MDMCQDEENGTFIVYLTWKNGKKTQHPKEVVYRRCPQKVSPSSRSPNWDPSAGLTLFGRCSGSTRDTFVFLATAVLQLPSEP